MSSVTPANHGNTHGSMKSYITGFILSLVFTLIPYYLVVNKTLSGAILLWVILSIAIAQMIIQITFFLHLGRGPKPNWNFYFFVSTVVIVLFVVAGSIIIISNLHYNMQPSDQIRKLINDEAITQVDGNKTGACHGTYNNHIVKIEDDLVLPQHTDARLCDSLTFMTNNKSKYKIIFGNDIQPIPYAGEAELNIQKYHNKTITLSQTGKYNFFIKDREFIIGEFSVTP